MNDQLATFSERLAGTSGAHRLLRRLGLDSRQFVIFLGLLRTLSEREEFVAVAGVDRFRLSYVAIFSGVMATFLWAGLAASGIPAALYLLINLLIGFIFIFPTITREAANALFNPVEASLLAASPVHSLTYAAAKIAHVLITVFYMTTALTLPAALIGIALKGTRWYWPVTHMAAAFLLGLSAAFLICALYGLMTKIVPVSLLKGFSMWLQVALYVALPYLAITFPIFWARLLTAKFEGGIWAWVPLTWFVEIGLLGCRQGGTGRFGWQGSLSIVAALIIIWFGLRSFAGTYFSESSSKVQGRRWHRKNRTALHRHVAALMRAITGSPVGLGAFSFISKMMRRDWRFRRNILTQTMCLPFCGLLVIMIAGGALATPPLARHQFSYAHFLPHLLGAIAMTLCTMIPFTDFHKGSWIYLTAPIGNLRAFARGVYWALWIPSAGLPHVILWPFLIRLWGWKEASLMAGFSLIVVSLYLAFEMKLIRGLPFSSPYDESHVAVGGLVPMLWFGGIMIAGIAQGVLFRAWWIALPAGIALAVATGSVLRMTLGGLEEEIRWRMHLLKQGPNQMFMEVG